MLRASSLLPRLAAASLFAVLPSIAPAQTVRFLTSVGDFYLELNPTGDANLEGHVDNLLAYIGTGRYHGSVINRAPEGFVLQLGGFDAGNFRPSTLPQGGFEAIDKFDDVIVDADGDGDVDFDALSNTVGTVSLALQSGQPNSGTSSFFVSLTDNSFLDAQGFVPFAEVTNLADLNKIMNLDKVDLSDQIGQSGSLAYTDVPLDEDGNFVTIESVMVLSDPFVDFAGPVRRVSSVLLDGEELLTGGGSESLTSDSANTDAGSPDANAPSPSMPEPSAAVLSLIAGAGVLARRRP